jgi:hypothetical protein
MLICDGSEATLALMASYCRIFLLTLKNHKDLKHILEEVRAEDWRKIISNPVIKLLDSVNADETTMRVVTMTMQEFCQ